VSDVVIAGAYDGPISPVKCLVPVSGGKDSQATLKLAFSVYKPEEIRGLFCDTGFEHPLTYAHIEKLRTLYGNIRIDTVRAGTVEEQCYKHKRFPGGGARFCTEELKIRPTKRYCLALAQQQGSRRSSKKLDITPSNEGGFEVWYGMRSDESSEREKRYAGKVCDEVYAPHEVMTKYPQYLAKVGVFFRLAVLHWTEDEIFKYLCGEHNPLYPHFDRVGCFPCQAAGDPHKEKAYQFDDFGRKQYRIIKVIAEKIKKPMFNSKGGQERDAKFNGCAICAM
jgi:3'-phosphoadenosine 5'-phosphosulfate sulfotransferase (PAPS reductase)/FAD synthetase